MVQRPIILTE